MFQPDEEKKSNLPSDREATAENVPSSPVLVVGANSGTVLVPTNLKEDSAEVVDSNRRTIRSED